MTKLSLITPEECLWDKGNTARLKAVMNRAATGEAVIVMSIGGSITEGAKAEGREYCYASLTADWWKAHFENVIAKNAGIGATGSVIGAYRAGTDLLAYKPDVVIIEFAVNDAKGGDYIGEYESIVRRCLIQGAAVMLLFLPRQDRCDVRAVHREIGRHYGLPMFSITDALEKHIDANQLCWEDYSPDAVHPNREGHGMIATVINAYLDSVYAEWQAGKTETVLPIPEAVNLQLWDSAVMLNRDSFVHDRAVCGSVETELLTAGEFTDTPTAFHHFPNGWTSEMTADGKLHTPMVVSVKGCHTLQLLYLRSVKPDSGSAEVTVTDGVTVKTFTLDASFVGGWGDYASAVSLYQSMTAANVTVTIKKMSGNFSVLRFMVS